MASNACWGIEIGAGAIKALKLERDGDNVRVLDYAIVPHRKALSDPDVDPADVMRVSLGTFAANTDLSGATIAVSMPGHAGLTRFTKLPPVEIKKVHDIVKFEAVQQIPFPLEEVEWDYQTFQNEDSPDVEVGIFAITKEKIGRELEQLEEVGVSPDVIMLSPVCVFNALAYDLVLTPQTPGTIMLDIGESSTDLIIAEGGGVWVRTFPLGGKHFTAALVDAFKLSYAKAEKLKREAEQSKHARHAFQAMRPVFSDLIQDVQRSIGYYQGIHQGAELKRLIGLGSTFKLPGLRKFLKQQLQMDVYRMERFKRLSLEGPRSGEFEAATLNFATCYGLALQGLGLETINANLMPVAKTRAMMWKRKTKWFATAAGFSLVASAAMFIRPMLDQAAVAGAAAPSVIQSSLGTFEDLKRDAEEAGVLGSGSPDFRAAEMLELAGDPGVYQDLLGEIVSLLAYSDAQASGGRAYEVVAVDTEYRGPSSGSGGGRGGFSGSGEDEIAVSAEEANSDERRIAVTLRLLTRQSDPQRFVLETIDKWLEENALRPGRGYFLAYDAGSYYELGAAGPPEAGGPRPPTGRAGRRGGPRDPNEQAPPETSGDSSELDKLAPLPRPEAPSGEATYLTVEFLMVLKEPEAEGGEDSEDLG